MLKFKISGQVLMLFFFLGKIELKNIYYFLILTSSLRLIAGIIYFLCYECAIECHSVVILTIIRSQVRIIVEIIKNILSK
jgi:hypothetical protein